MFDFSSSPLLARRTPGERTFRPLSIVMIGFGIAFFVPYLIGLFPGVLATVVLGINGFLQLFGDAMSSGLSGEAGTFDSEAYRAFSENLTASPGYRIAVLFGEAWLIAVSLFVCLAIQRRSVATMGIEKRGAAKRYGIGFLIGAVLCSVAVWISCLSRASSFGGFRGERGYLYLVFFLIGYLICGAAETILIHGLIMTGLARRFRWLPSVFISALLFSAMHVLNDGVTLLSFLNLFLFGVFLGLYVIRTGSVFGAMAIHAAWSVVEGSVFGCPVGGVSSPSSLFAVVSDASRSTTNGGAVGPMGGLAATMALMLALIAVLFLPPIGAKRRQAP